MERLVAGSSAGFHEFYHASAVARFRELGLSRLPEGGPTKVLLALLQGLHGATCSCWSGVVVPEVARGAVGHPRYWLPPGGGCYLVRCVLGTQLARRSKEACHKLVVGYYTTAQSVCCSPVYFELRQVQQEPEWPIDPANSTVCNTCSVYVLRCACSDATLSCSCLLTAKSCGHSSQLLGPRRSRPCKGKCLCKLSNSIGHAALPVVSLFRIVLRVAL